MTVKRSTHRTRRTALLVGLCCFLFSFVSAQEGKQSFLDARDEIKAMLDGKQSLNYERAVFVMENAYLDDAYSFDEFKLALDINEYNIRCLTKEIINSLPVTPQANILISRDSAIANRYRAMANYAIFRYMTDTTANYLDNKLFLHYPYRYSYKDPFASRTWEHTQVINLLNYRTNTGNCLAMASLFKILSLRLGSDAKLCTTQGHIFITHSDENGRTYNIELASQTFPGTGTIETLTHTSDEAARRGIAMRELDLRQSIALCFVNLAKGYQHKFSIKADDFVYSCIDLALHYDTLNLNAVLLKAEVMEEQLLSSSKTFPQLQRTAEFKTYQAFISHLYEIGYHEMPTDMKNRLVAALAMDSTYRTIFRDNTYYPFANIDKRNVRSASLSGGLFEEVDIYKPKEKFFRTVYDTKAKKITAFEPADTLYNNYGFDPSGFALSIDPLFFKYPMISPYAAFANNPIYYIDRDGAELFVNGNQEVAKTDLISLLPPEPQSGNAVNYRAAFHVSPAGVVSFDITEAQANASGDPGVQLLYNLVKAQERYEYNVSNTVTVGQAPDVSAPDNPKEGTLNQGTINSHHAIKGEFIQIDLTNQTTQNVNKVGVPTGDIKSNTSLGIENASRTPMVNKPYIKFDVPADPNLNSQVTFPQVLQIDQYKGGPPKSRTALLFHELQEAYNRTTKKMQYQTAHDASIDTEKTFPATDPRRDNGYEGKAVPRR